MNITGIMSQSHSNYLYDIIGVAHGNIVYKGNSLHVSQKIRIVTPIMYCIKKKKKGSTH